MQTHILLMQIFTLYFALGLSAQERSQAQTAFTFPLSEEKSTLQQLMKISESNPHVKELFFLEEQPEMQKGTISVGTAKGSNSFAYSNFTAAEMYAKILQVHDHEIHAAKELGDKRYNLFYHSGGLNLDEELRNQIAHRFLERIDIKVSEDDSVITDRMVFRAHHGIDQSLAQPDELGTASVHSGPFKISARNKSLSGIFKWIQKHPLFKHYQLVDQTGLSEEQTLDVDLSTESIDDLIASAAEQGLEITMEEGKGRKVMLTPQ